MCQWNEHWGRPWGGSPDTPDCSTHILNPLCCSHVWRCRSPLKHMLCEVPQRMYLSVPIILSWRPHQSWCFSPSLLNELYLHSCYGDGLGTMTSKRTLSGSHVSSRGLPGSFLVSVIQHPCSASLCSSQRTTLPSAGRTREGLGCSWAHPAWFAVRSRGQAPGVMPF